MKKINKNLVMSTVFSTVLTIGLLSFFGFSSKDTVSEPVKESFNNRLGTVVIWPGSVASIPRGWRLCDGSELSKNKYIDLYEKLETYWIKDQGGHKDFFRLPDLRGVFLRGVNGDRNDRFKDETVKERLRVRSTADKSKNAPGSFQTDAMVNITGTFLGSNPNQSAEGAIRAVPYPIGDLNQWGHSGGDSRGRKFIFDASKSDGVRVSSENRPINAYVHFIIYVGK